MNADSRLSRRDFIKVAGIVAGSAVLAACGKENEPTPTALYIASPTGTPSPNPTFAPSIFSETPTATPIEVQVMTETQSLQEYLLGNWESFKTHYLAGKNHLVDESNGYAEVALTAFGSYFSARQEVAATLPQVFQADRMFAGLFQPVKDFRDRAPDFDKRNGGQGLGFTTGDLTVLRTVEDSVGLLATGQSISRFINEGYDRGWMLARANQADAAVLALVDNWLMIYHHKDSLAAENQALRQQTFYRIIYGDLGVMPSGTTDQWWTVTSNGRFDIACSTFTADAGYRSSQPENSRLLSFRPALETDNGVEQEQETVLDARGKVLVPGAIGPDGHLRVEVYTLSNAPDALNSDQDKPEDKDVSAAGYRWLPCGVGAPAPQQPGQPGQPKQPESTPPAISTPMKKNPEQFEPEPPANNPPSNPQPTQSP